MNLMNIEPNEPINVTPMSAQEARECVATIKSNLESLGAMLLDLDRRRGWEALGYASFRECAVAEFGKSQGYVYKLLHAAEVDENLAASEIYPLDKSEIALIPTSHKEELHKLPDEQQAEALQQADVLAQAEGNPREARHVAFVVKEYKSVAAQTEAKGQELGLPTRGDSTLPESDRIDDLTHTSPDDVDDRLGAPPNLPRFHKHGIVAGDTVRVLLGKGKHSDKITTATSVTAKEIVTPLGTFKPSALVKYIDRSAEMKTLGIVPGVIVETSDGTKAEVICTFVDGRVSVSGGRYYNYSELTAVEPESAEAESDAIATSVEEMLPEILANDCEPLAQTSDIINGEAAKAIAPTPALWQAEQEKLAYLVQALQKAQAEIKQLKDERDSLETECLALHAQNGDLNNEIAHLLGELAALKQQ